MAALRCAALRPAEAAAFGAEAAHSAEQTFPLCRINGWGLEARPPPTAPEAISLPAKLDQASDLLKIGKDGTTLCDEGVSTLKRKYSLY